MVIHSGLFCFLDFIYLLSVKRNWSEIGILRFLLPFILGILFFKTFSIGLLIPSILFILSFIILVALKMLSTRYIFRAADLLFGISTMLLFFFLGAIIFLVSESEFEKKLNSPQDYLIGTVISEPIEKAKTYKVEVKVDFQNDANEEKKTQAILYLQKDSLSASLKNGNVLKIKNKLKIPDSDIGHPGFDYRAFLAQKQIYFTAYIKDSEWSLVGYVEEGLYSRGISALRSNLQLLLNTYIKSDKERSIASALLLGNKAFLDKDTKVTYSETGAMHILAVSGLHVGILYGFLALMLKHFKRTTFSRRALAIVEILVIWIFAAITDFSPSVTRATVMFSFLALGSVFLRTLNSYNILGISALLLLAFKPQFLFEVGFQLSYAAVISIIFFHKYIYKLFHIKNRIIDFFWSISAVSIAAQIGTAPLTMYYFEQFPTYFWVSNLVAIPAASIILWLGLIFFICGLFSLLINIDKILMFLASIIENVIAILNRCLTLVQEVPYATIDMNYFNGLNALTLYLVVISLMYFLYTNTLKSKTFRFLICAIVLHIGLSTYTSARSEFGKKEIENRNIRLSSSSTSLAS